MSEFFIEPDPLDIKFENIHAVIDEDGSVKILNNELSSYNFDGVIPLTSSTILVNQIKPGMLFFPVGASAGVLRTLLSIDFDDPQMIDTPSSDYILYYLDDNRDINSFQYSASNSITIVYENWDEKLLGSAGWTITQGGNAIFSNVAVRGEIEATTLDVGGSDGITYDGNTVTIGASVVINAPLTVGGNFIVSGSAAQDIISNNTTITGGNIATGRIKSTGYSGPGTGSAFSTTGMLINLDDGGISSKNFRVDPDGNAFLQGGINATSGSFSGWLRSASISSGIILGQQIVAGSLTASTNTGQIVISSSGIFGSTASGLFHLDSIDGEVTFTGDITANSGVVKKLTIGAGKSYPIINLTGTASVTNASQSGNFILTVDPNIKAFYPGDYFYINGFQTSGSAFQDTFPTTASVFFNTRSLNKDGVWTSPFIYQILTASYSSYNRYFCRLQQSGLSSNYDFSQVTASSGSINFGYVYFGEYSSYSIAGGTFIDGLVFSTVGPGTYFQNYIPDYIDLNGRFSLGKGKIKFDGTTLNVNGYINATSGSFSGWIKSASITGGIISSGSFVTGILQSRNYSGVTDGSAFSTKGSHINLNNGTLTAQQFRIDDLGNAAFAGSLSSGISISSPVITGGTLSSTGYSGVTDGSAFSTTGTHLNLNTGAITARQFRIDTSGNAFFGGSLNAPGGTIGGFTIASTSLTAGSSPNIIGITTGGNSFFAGAQNTTGLNAVFNVTSAGALTATNANLTGTITGSTFRSSTGITSTAGNGVYLDASGNVRFATSNGTVLQFDSNGLGFNGGTLRLGSQLSGGILYGSVNFYTNAGGTIGSISSAASNKTWSGLGDGITIGTSSDYIFIPASGNTTRSRYLGSGFNWYDSSSNLLMSLAGGVGTFSVNRNTVITGTTNLSGNTVVTGTFEVAGNNLSQVTNGDFRLFSSATSFTPMRIVNGAKSTAEVRAEAIDAFVVASTPVHIQGAANNYRLVKGSSSRRYKENIIPYNRNTNDLLQVEPVYYNYIQDEKKQQLSGFIAEDLDDLGLTEFVNYDNGVPESIGYDRMVAALFKIVKEQQEIINNLNNSINNITSRLDAAGL